MICISWEAGLQAKVLPRLCPNPGRVPVVLKWEAGRGREEHKMKNRIGKMPLACVARRNTSDVCRTRASDGMGLEKCAILMPNLRSY